VLKVDHSGESSTYEFIPFELNMGKNSYELVSMQEGSMLRVQQQGMWVQLVMAREEPSLKHNEATVECSGGMRHNEHGNEHQQHQEAFFEDGSSRLRTQHCNPLPPTRHNIISPRGIPSLPPHDTTISPFQSHTARSDVSHSTTTSQLPLNRQKFHLVLCANNRRRSIHRGNTSSTTSSTDRNLTPHLSSTGILHILNKDDEGSFFFSAIPTTNEITQHRPSCFVVHNQQPQAYVCGSFHNQYQENEITPVYFFNFRHSHWMVMERQKFINRALSDRSKLIERRYGHSMVYFRNNLYVFGGFRSKQQYTDSFASSGVGASTGEKWLNSKLGGATNEIIRFDIKRQTWNRVIAFQQWHAQHMCLPAGDDDERMSVHDKYEYSDSESSSSSLLPASRYLPGRGMHIMSDRRRTQAPMRLYISHVESKMFPAPRLYHSATLFNSTMIIFGGLLEHNDMCSNEVYAFDLLQRCWKRLWSGHEAKGGIFESPEPDKCAPVPRKLHSACRHGDLLFIFGGMDQHNKPLNDLFVFSLTTLRWTRIDYSTNLLPEGDAPSGRFGHVAFVLPPMSAVVTPPAPPRMHGGGVQDDTAVNPASNVTLDSSSDPLDSIIETNEDPALIILGGYAQHKDASIHQDGYIVRIPSSLFAQNTKENLYMPLLDEFADTICLVHGEMFHVHICIVSQSRVLAREFARRHEEGSRVHSVGTEGVHSSGDPPSERGQSTAGAANPKVLLDFSTLHRSLGNIQPHTFYHVMILMYGGFVSDLSHVEVDSLLAAAEHLQMDDTLISELKNILTHWDYDTSHVGMFLSGKKSLYHHLHSIYDTFHGKEIEFADIVIRGKDGQVFATHKYLLCARFEYFCTVLRGRKRAVREIPLLYSRHTIAILHASLYMSPQNLAGLLPLRETSQLFDLLEATHELMMQELHEMVMQRLCLSLSMDNFTSVIEWCRIKRDVLMHPKWIQNASAEFLSGLSSHERLALLMQDKTKEE